MRTDAELARLVARHDSGAFEALVRRYEEVIRRRVLRIVRDEAAVDDLVQNVALRIWQKASQWDEKGPFKKWLLRIATNEALNHLRSVQRRPRLLAPCTTINETDEGYFIPGWMVDASALGPAEIVAQAEEEHLLRNLVDNMSEVHREVLRMVYDEEMKLTDVAEALGMPLGTIKSRLFYARKQLTRRWLESQDK